MNLLFAIKSINGIGGGAERVLTQVASGLAARGHRVSVLSFDPPGESFYPLSTQVHRLDMACGEPGQSLSVPRFIGAIPQMRRLLRALKPDVVIPFMHSAYVPLYFALSGLGLTFIASEHTEARHFETRPIQRGLRKWVVKRSAASTTASEGARQSFLRSDGLDSLVVSNPINLAEFSGAGTIPAIEPPTVLSIGNLRAEKGHGALIAAFAKLAPEFPPWHLRIVGDGELRSELEMQRSRLGLEDRVELAGFSDNVAAEYARARFVVLPSRYESFGLAAAEALASGRAVLAFDDCAGIGEVVEHATNGLLVAGGPNHEDRVRNLAGGLRRLMSEPDLASRLGAAGPQAVARFDLPAVLDRWEEVIRMTIARTERRSK